MSADWFFTNYPASRSVIENDVRLKLWQSGFKGLWITCVKETAPFECQGNWNSNDFALEWEPKNFLQLKMSAPNQDVLNVFEKALKHKALAAYKNADGSVIVEWRVNNADARFQELQASNALSLERLDK